MSENKTQETEADVGAFIAGLSDARRRAECAALVEMMRDATGAEPRMWGESIVGFGRQHLTYASGRKVDWFKVGFSPRKQAMTLYLTYGIEHQADLLGRLGGPSCGKGCLYLKRLEGLDMGALRELIDRTLSGALQAGGAAE